MTTTQWIQWVHETAAIPGGLNWLLNDAGYREFPEEARNEVERIERMVYG